MTTYAMAELKYEWSSRRKMAWTLFHEPAIGNCLVLIVEVMSFLFSVPLAKPLSLFTFHFLLSASDFLLLSPHILRQLVEYFFQTRRLA